MVAASAIEMYKKDGADGLAVTDAHAGLVNDVLKLQQVELPAVCVVAGHICHLCAVLLSVVRLAAQLAFGWERREGDSYPTEAGGALPGDGCQRTGADGRVCVRLRGRVGVVRCTRDEGAALE